jgi:hypothetical protein
VVSYVEGEVLTHHCQTDQPDVGKLFGHMPANLPRRPPKTKLFLARLLTPGGACLLVVVGARGGEKGSNPVKQGRQELRLGPVIEHVEPKNAATDEDDTEYDELIHIHQLTKCDDYDDDRQDDGAHLEPEGWWDCLDPFEGRVGC